MFNFKKVKTYVSAYEIKGKKTPKHIWFNRKMGGDKNHAKDLLRFFCQQGYKVERINADRVYMVMSS